MRIQTEKKLTAKGNDSNKKLPVASSDHSKEELSSDLLRSLHHSASPSTNMAAARHCMATTRVLRCHNAPMHLSLTRHYSALPRIAQPGLWQGMVPKAFRSSSASGTAAGRPATPSQKKPSNPFLVYAFMFMLIGSNAVNQIGMRNQLTEFRRRTDAQLGLLKEVIRRVHAGEEVDVEGILGAGDEAREKEWEEVLAEVEGVEELWERQKRRVEGRRKDAAAEEAGEEDTKADALGNNDHGQDKGGVGQAKQEASKKRFGFY